MRCKAFIFTLLVTSVIIALVQYGDLLDDVGPPAVVEIRNCTMDNSTLVGPIPVEVKIAEAFPAMKKLTQTVNKGGWWEPTTCVPTVKVAVIVPYRNREIQLKLLLNHMHPFLQKQNLYYRIIVVEQLPGADFNKAMLLNVGFVEAQKISHFDCFVFNDVDHLPEDDRNYYGCPTSPRYMAIAVDKYKYKVAFPSTLIGVFAMKKAHFEKTNGMSNSYWGWGGEDDDIYMRTVTKKLKMTRPAMEIGRYTTLKQHHFRSSTPGPLRFKLLKSAAKRMDGDGLNTLIYYLKEVTERPLVTFIKVQLNQSDYTVPVNP